jgi:DNA replication protein DnaC
MTNQQYDRVLTLARERNIDLNRCPTCRNPRTEVAPGIYVWGKEVERDGIKTLVPSTYRYIGEEHECHCEWQDALRRHYLLANIPMGYWTLGVEEFWGDEKALAAAQQYLDCWEDHKWIGFGIEFYSPRMGVGKTMLATIIAKQLVQRRERVYFTSFRDAVSALSHEAYDAEEQIARLRNTPVLVLDEVGKGWTQAMQSLYAHQFEDLIRHRTSGTAVTIMTTNMTPDELNDEYKRVHSLLSAKQITVHVNGEDARTNGAKKLMDLELAQNHEARPIT